MTSEKATLRVRQKQLRREKMLHAARTLFVEGGYSGTTMDAIAAHAGVGVATVHIYFTTKEGLFAELAKMDMSELKQEAEELLQQLPDDPVASIKALLDVYLKVQNYISFDVVQDFVMGSKKPGPMHEVSVWINEWRTDQLTRALEQCRDAGTVSKALPLQEMSGIIVDLLIRFYNRVMSGQDSEHEYKKLMRRIELLFEDWRGNQAVPD